MEKKQYLTDGDVAFLPVSEEYLTDESGGMGWAEQICFPANAGEACLAPQRARQAGLPVALQGGRGRICGGGLPPPPAAPSPRMSPRGPWPWSGPARPT